MSATGNTQHSRRVRAVALAASAAAMFVAAPAAAHANTLTTCGFSMHLAFHDDAGPGVIGGLPHPRHVSFLQDGPGTANCVGEVAGQTVLSQGTARIRGAIDFDALCLQGVGTGSVVVHVPRFPAFALPPQEKLEGTFDLDLSDVSWRQVGSLVDTVGQSVSFVAVSSFVPDAGHGCDVNAGTLTGQLVAGGS